MLTQQSHWLVPGMHPRIPGTHLFPLERPEACGQRLQAFLDKVGVPAPA
ncbi:hypothetical protein [Cystobacter ferrugineus]|nr:hypothetical protein [Cystobacter ferrugineus]